MMSVLEYAEDVNKTVNQILKLCKELNIEATGEEDELDEDAITELDNVIAMQEEDDEFESEDELIEKENEKIENIVNNSKPKKQNQNSKPKVSKKDLARKKKEMYKSKEKLISNGPVQNTNVVTYKDGMTIGDLAKELGVQPNELIKKLFMLGILATVNNKVDFDNAELLVSEYGKELKRETIVDETKFEEFEITDNEEDLVKRPPVVTIMGHVARKTAEYDTDLYAPMTRSFVMSVAQEVVKQAYMEKGRVDAYRPDRINYLTDDQFGYVAGVGGIMMRDKPAACFYLGTFYAESLILAETGNSIGAIQIAGTAEPSQIPFFVAACDYTLIGEELFAASAYLSKNPREVGSLKGQDMVKVVIIAAIILGTLLETIAATDYGQKIGFGTAATTFMEFLK